MADAKDIVQSGILGPSGSGIITSGLEEQFAQLKNITGGGASGGNGSALVNIAPDRLRAMRRQAMGDSRPGMFRQSPSFYHPLFEAINLQLPTKSFFPGTLITMADGTQKAIEEFAPGDEVISHDGSVEVVEFTEHHPATGGSIEITAQGMDLPLRVTSGHKVYALRAEDVECDREKKPGFCSLGESTHCKRVSDKPGVRGGPRCASRQIPITDPRPIEAFKIKKGDYIFVPVVDGIEEMKPFAEKRYASGDTRAFVHIKNIPVDAKMMRLLGYFGSEGCTHRRPDGEIHGTMFSFNANEKDTLAQEVVDLIQDVFGKKAWKTVTQHNVCNVQISGKHIGEWFVKHCGKLAKEKVLSREVMFADPALQVHFLATYANGDGYQIKDGSSAGKVVITTASENMASQLAIIARRCGMAPTKKYEYRKDGFAGINPGRPTWSWQIGISNGYIDPLIGISKFKKFGDKAFAMKKMVIHKKWIAHKVTSVKEIAYVGEVWNIGVRKHAKILVPYNEPHLLLHGRSRGGKQFEVHVQISGTTTDGNHSVIANGYACTQSREINQWCRHFRKTDGYVGALLDQHSEFPLTGMHIVCDDPKVKRFFEILFFDILKGPRLLEKINGEYWTMANVFPFGNWDDDKGIWTGFSLLNPDFVEVEKSSLIDEPVLKLDPDDNLKRIVASRQPKELYEKLCKIENGELVNMISRGEKIPLNKFRVSHLAFKLSDYETVGTPIMFRAFKPLIQKDMIRRVQMAVYERHILPLKLIKVGSDQMPANPEAIKQVREAMEELSTDLSAWFVYHHAIQAEYVSSAGKIHPFDNENKWIREEIFAALMGNEAMVGSGGGGMSFATASIGMQIVINRYMRNQRVLCDWIKDTIFRPVAIAQDFKRQSEWGEEYIVPEVEFEFMKLKDDAQMKGLMKELMKSGLVSKQTFYTYMGLDETREQKQIAREKAAEKADVLKSIKPTAPPPAPGAAGGMPPMGGGGGGGGETPGTEPPTPGEEMPASAMGPGES